MLLDSRNTKKFMRLTSDKYVQSALRHVEDNSITLFRVVEEKFSDQYTNDAAWLVVAKEWTTLRQACNLFKAEGMKVNIMMGSPELYIAQPLTPGMQNTLLEGCPKGWKAYLIPVLSAEQGNPIEQVTEKLNQLSDLSGLNSEDSVQGQRRTESGKGEPSEQT